MRSHGRGTRIKQDGLISPEQLGRVSDANRTIDDLQNRLAQIATATAIGQTRFSGDNTLLNTLEALQSAHTAVAGLSLQRARIRLTGLAGLWGRGQAGKRKTAEATATEIVKSIDRAAVDGVVKLADLKQDRATERGRAGDAGGVRVGVISDK